MILSRLRSAGMRPYRAEFPLSSECRDPLLVDLLTIDRAAITALNANTQTPGHRPIVLLGDDPQGATSFDALIVTRDKDLSILKGRLTALARRNMRMSEITLRRQTAADFGVALPSPEPATMPEILYLGDGSPRFLALQAALNARGIAVTAALSIQTAADYVLHKNFAAAFVDVTSENSQIRTASGWSSTCVEVLAGLPVFALIEPDETHVRMTGGLFAHASEIVAHEHAARHLAEKLDMLSRQYLQASLLLPAARLASGISDIETGLFSRAFFNSHLERQMNFSNHAAEPLSLFVLKHSQDRPFTKEQRQELAKILKAGLRQTDCPASLDRNVMAVSLPATGYQGATQLADRIVKKASQSCPDMAGQLSWRITEKRAYHTCRTLLATTLSGPFNRADAA